MTLAPALCLALSCVLFGCDAEPKPPGRSRDIDGDGVPNVVDNCPGLANRRQLDLDGDGLGIACDAEYSGAARAGFEQWAAKRFELRCAWYKPGANPGRTGCAGRVADATR